MSPDEGTGVGDDDFSYAADLNRNKAWHGGGKVYGSGKWKAGDVLGTWCELPSDTLTRVNNVSQLKFFLIELN